MPAEAAGKGTVKKVTISCRHEGTTWRRSSLFVPSSQHWPDEEMDRPNRLVSWMQREPRGGKGDMTCSGNYSSMILGPHRHGNGPRRTRVTRLGYDTVADGFCEKLSASPTVVVNGKQIVKKVWLGSAWLGPCWCVGRGVRESQRERECVHVTNRIRLDEAPLFSPPPPWLVLPQQPD
jgi:hypothetical protein